MEKRIISLFLCLILLPCLCATAFADDDESSVKELNIHNLEDFLSFAENCILDSYSKDLIVNLHSNIDLSDSDFSSIPIFCGIFNGNNHSITGLSLDNDGSVQGLFRYITVGAEVNKLNVYGNVEPGGSHSQLGGIAGSNSGKIINCSFEGTVSGSSYIGGIAGKNTVSGIVENCSTSGHVFGDHFVGGIVGDNSGVIRKCINSAEINNSAKENSVELSDITIEAMANSESANTVTDVGGIAGFSKGVIRDCDNFGLTGYRQMGYNIGGIVGTQSGYVTDCQNFAQVHGRKEVGGIAGQMQPVSIIEYAEDTLQILQGQLNAMSGLVNQASYNASANASNMGSHMAVLQDQTGTALDAISTIIFSDRTDQDSITAAENTLNSVMSDLPNSFNNVSVAMENAIYSMSGDMQALAAQISAMSETIGNATETVGGTIKDISDEDSPNSLSGKIEDCINQGLVDADLNAGGIVGAISVENDLDSFEDIKSYGEQSLNIESKLRSVIRDCENHGKVKVSRQNAGGIVGLQTMGLVRDNENCGEIGTESAQYVGGISGQSSGFIRNSNAKCVIYGSSYVGGIAGTANVVTNCRSMVKIENTKERQGAVLGLLSDVKTDVADPISSNYYMSIESDIGGIDGISYEGLALRLSKDEFMALEDLSSIFKKANISFKQDNGVIKKFSVDMGQAFDLSKAPKLFEKEGYLVRWAGLDESDLSKVYFDKLFEAEYTQKLSVIQSNKNDLGLAYMLAHGEFEPGDEISLSDADYNGELLLGEKLLYSKEFKFNSNSENKVRIFSDSANSVKLRIMNEAGHWRDVQFTVEGSYLVTDINSKDVAFAVFELVNWETVLITAGAVTLFFFVLILCITKKKKT